MKLYKSLAIALIAVGASFNVNAQTCAADTIEFVEAGTRFEGVLIRSNNRACGSNGFVCATGGNLAAAGAETQVYAAALTAQASESVVQLSWDTADVGCGAGNFPIITQLRIQ